MQRYNIPTQIYHQSSFSECHNRHTLLILRGSVIRSINSLPVDTNFYEVSHGKFRNYHNDNLEARLSGILKAY